MAIITAVVTCKTRVQFAGNFAIAISTGTTLLKHVIVAFFFTVLNILSLSLFVVSLVLCFFLLFSVSLARSFSFSLFLSPPLCFSFTLSLSPFYSLSLNLWLPESLTFFLSICDYDSSTRIYGISLSLKNSLSLSQEENLDFSILLLLSYPIFLRHILQSPPRTPHMHAAFRQSRIQDGEIRICGSVTSLLAP